MIPPLELSPSINASNLQWLVPFNTAFSNASFFCLLLSVAVGFPSFGPALSHQHLPLAKLRCPRGPTPPSMARFLPLVFLAFPLSICCSARLARVERSEKLESRQSESNGHPSIHNFWVGLIIVVMKPTPKKFPLLTYLQLLSSMVISILTEGKSASMKTESWPTFLVHHDPSVPVSASNNNW